MDIREIPYEVSGNIEYPGFLHEQILSNLRQTLVGHLKKAKRTPFNFMERVSLINQLILGSMWYVVTLWSGNDKELHGIEKEIVNFLWVGQKESSHPRVSIEVLFQAKQHGGLGLILLKAQVACLATKILLWVALAGDHPL